MVRWLSSATRRVGLVATLALALALVLVAAAGSGPAEAQDPPTARIEFPDGAAWYEFVVHDVTASGGIGDPVATLERPDLGEPAAADVPPDCYVVVVRRTGGPGGTFEDPISNQPAFCVAAGETKVFELGGHLPTASGRNVLNGEVRDPDGNYVSDAVIDFFEPPSGLTPNEVRLLDHATADHRGPWLSSQISGPFNWIYASVFKLCRIQTLTAPDGYSWSGGRQYLSRSACASDYKVAIAYPDSGPSPADGFIEIEVPAYDGISRLSGTIGLAEDSPLPERLQWFRALEYPYQARFAVPPGCHQVELNLANGRRVFTATGRAVQSIDVCAASSQTVAVEPVGEVREVIYDLAQPYLVGSFVDETGAPVPGVQVDLFYGRADVSFDDLRLVDHSADDYRGPFYRSTSSDDAGRYRLPTYQSCLVATFVAPEGYSFGGGRYRQQTICQGDDQRPVVLQADAGPARFGGRVVTESDHPVPGVLVDVFAPIDGITDEELRSVDHVAVDYRGSYAQTATTGPEGRFGFQAQARCWVLTYVGDDRITFPTGRYLRQTLCPGDSPTVVVPDVGQPDSGRIEGAVTGGPEVVADLFVATADGSRGPWLGDVATSNGRYAFEVEPGCYVTVLIAPDDYTFASSGGRYQQMPGCVAEGKTWQNPVGELVR